MKSQRNVDTTTMHMYTMTQQRRVTHAIHAAIPRKTPKRRVVPETTASHDGSRPEFQLKQYQEVLHEWSDRPFYRERVRCFLTIPIRFNHFVKKTKATIQQDEDQLVLTPMQSVWGCDVLFSVTPEEAIFPENIDYVSGTFASKVFSGTRYNTVPWVAEMQRWVRSTTGRDFDLNDYDSDRCYIYYPARNSFLLHAVIFVKLD